MFYCISTHLVDDKILSLNFFLYWSFMLYVTIYTDMLIFKNISCDYIYEIMSSIYTLTCLFLLIELQAISIILYI